MSGAQVAEGNRVIKIQSLKSTIIVQFVVILLPVVAVLAYQTEENARRTATMDKLYRHHGLALQAKERFGAFGNGAADAVDTSELSKNALAALRDSRDRLAELGAESASSELLQVSENLDAMVRVLARDPSLASLQTLREQINAARGSIAIAQARYDKLLDNAILQSIADEQTETRLVILVSLLVLGIAVWFVFRMIRYLSEPLGLAVSVADRIAEGRPVAESEFDIRFDLGNLIKSLGRMYSSLNRYQGEARDYQRGLEGKIQELGVSQSSLAEAQRLARIGNWHWDTSEPLAHWSDEMYRILDLGPGACAPTLENFLEIVYPSEREAVGAKIRGLMAASGSFSLEHHLKTSSGEERVLYSQNSSQAGPDGKVVRLYGTIQDITERKRAEEKIQRLAHYDSLTGLPNRQHFRDQLDHAVARARRRGERLAAMFVDLDRFKRINDTLGHAAGDLLLKGVAARLSTCVRAGDYVAREGVDAGEDAPAGQVARLGGDEFTITLDAIHNPRDAATVARRILTEMSKPFDIEGHEVVITTSIGLAMFPDDGGDADVLLKNADAAMYQAKELGKNTYQFFAKEMNTETFEKLTLENELRRALDRRQFVLHYQPKIDARTGHIAGVEALMRWDHPKWGLVPPVQFIPVAEEIGLIVAMGEWVLDEACRQLRAWDVAGFPPIEMAVNLAAPSFRQPDLITRVTATLRRHAVPAERLVIEATESILMRDVGATMTTLTQLRDLGVKISIDDFGTGYSSLSYLRRFPIDQLKIDRSFVKDVTENPDDAAISTAIISLGHSLKLEVVAEGVETLRQARMLQEQGCRMMQGYYFSRPLPVSDLVPLLNRGPEFAEQILESLRGLPAPAAVPADAIAA